MRSLFGMKLEKAAIALALLLVALSTVPATAFAQAAPSDSGEDVEVVQTTSIEDRIPPVSGRLFYKKHRFELSPTVTMSFGDAFFQKIGLGLKADYHIFDSLSVTANVLYNFNVTSRAVTVCDEAGNCERPDVDSMTKVPGKLGLVLGAGLAWTPLYGKLSLLAEQFIHFDFGITGGVDGIQYMTPETADGPNANTFTFGGHVGIVFRIAFTERMALRFELRDYIYSGETVALGDSTSKIENQIMFELGFSYLLGAGSED